MLTTPLLMISMIFMSAPSTPAQASRLISNYELRGEKHGRVIDADSGAGIPGAKVIANWRASSTGAPGLYGGGSWCDLQKIVTTDANGNYTTPDVSKDLDISDRGTHSGVTGMGLLTVKHDADYRLSVFKPGYVRVGDMEVLTKRLSLARQLLLNNMTFQTTPDIESLQAGKITVKPIALKKIDLDESNLRSPTRWKRENDSALVTRHNAILMAPLEPPKVRFGQICVPHAARSTLDLNPPSLRTLC